MVFPGMQDSIPYFLNKVVLNLFHFSHTVVHTFKLASENRTKLLSVCVWSCFYYAVENEYEVFEESVTTVA